MQIDVWRNNYKIIDFACLFKLWCFFFFLICLFKLNHSGFGFINVLGLKIKRYNPWLYLHSQYSKFMWGSVQKGTMVRKIVYKSKKGIGFSMKCNMDNGKRRQLYKTKEWKFWSGLGKFRPVSKLTIFIRS